uniref:Uncharacterized protein n=1 Tax=Arion vulgaris TaxID=1028688 RepID=A0A0B7A337_9EUPU
MCPPEIPINILFIVYKFSFIRNLLFCVLPSSHHSMHKSLVVTSLLCFLTSNQIISAYIAAVAYKSFQHIFLHTAQY